MRLLGIFVKHPLPGAVKTRLAAELGAAYAAEIYEAFLHAIVDRFRDEADGRRLCYAPATGEAEAYFRTLAAGNYELWPQPETDLGARMSRFFSEHCTNADDRVVIIGSDSPTVPAEHIERAFELLNDSDVVLGPAIDGGFYLIAQRGRTWPMLDDIEWSTPRVLEQTVMQIVRSGARLALLPPWYDVDTVADWNFTLGHLRAMAAASSEQPEAALRRLLAMDTPSRGKRLQ